MVMKWNGDEWNMEIMGDGHDEVRNEMSRE